jgi:hypothetical protein
LNLYGRTQTRWRLNGEWLMPVAAIQVNKMVKVENRWKSEEAPASEGLESLVYRPRLLGGDRTLVNIYGGNTSTKSEGIDHLGRHVMQRKRTAWRYGTSSHPSSMSRSSCTPTMCTGRGLRSRSSSHCATHSPSHINLRDSGKSGDSGY